MWAIPSALAQCELEGFGWTWSSSGISDCAFPISLNVFCIVAVVLDSLKRRHHGKVPYPRRGGLSLTYALLLRYWKKLVLSQVSAYLNSHNLYNICQSAYRPGYSTETLLKVVNDLILSLNKGNISVLALLDFSSAFDTIDHTILAHRRHTDFGFTYTVLQWFSSYLTDRTHYVSLSNHCSAFAPVHSGFSSRPYSFHHEY